MHVDWNRVLYLNHSFVHVAATRRLNGKTGQEKWGKHTCSIFGGCYPELGKKVLCFRASEEEWERD